LTLARHLFAVLIALLLTVPAHAEVDAQALWNAAMKAAIHGPANVPLADEAVLHVPSTMAYIPIKEAAALMEGWGNSVGGNFHGVVFEDKPDSPWFITINKVAEGYVKDDEARTWNADDLLQSLKDGTAAQNEVRKERGISGLDILGWIEPPTYDGSTHRLVWSMRVRDQAAAEGQDNGVNYNTYALGRSGYFEINLITGEKTIAQDKQAARTVLAALEYNQGKRYTDFVEGTDHVAEYGLAALVAGVAAKKLGMLAVIGVFFAKFAKIILAVAAVGAGGLFKFFRRKPTSTE
jgi:uncharacterized membrane-anchored protein